jgi:superfamily II DNA or RNA helicase
MKKSEIKKYVSSKLGRMNDDQKSLFDEMYKNDKLQICIPTGAGKGFLMIADILNQVVNTENKIFAVATHRLMLNTQHFNDIFDILTPFIGQVGFIFVGSSKYDTKKLQENTDLNKALLEAGLSFNEIISSTTIGKEVDEMVQEHLEKGRKVVLLSTYHSLHTLKNLEIDSLYPDEAHTLASEVDGSQFRKNFEQIKYKRCLFFTATPKDCTDEETEAFLMNNEDIFGIRIGLNFRHCVDKGYITRPIVHIAEPSNLCTNYNFDSEENMSIFVTETFEAHKKFLKSSSVSPDKIAPKILVKCSGVPMMWKIYNRLVGQMGNVKICAGASAFNADTNFQHFIDGEGIKNRSEYLERLVDFKDDEPAIVLHYDTMSEGINVSGFTGTMFLNGKLGSTAKILQNTGRSTRLHPEDRSNLVKGLISTSDYSKWIKPNCAVIIPYWDTESEFSAREIARKIKELRDNFGFEPDFKVSIGSDIGDSTADEALDGLNEKSEKAPKYKLVEDIKHIIEELDQAEINLAKQAEIDRLSVEEWFNLANDL